MKKALSATELYINMVKIVCFILINLYHSKKVLKINKTLLLESGM